MVGLKVLDRKLLRNLRGMAGQGLAIALVIAGGISLFLLMAGMTGSLSETRRTYYERYAFADIWAPVVRAPESLRADIRAIDGVRALETRVRDAALLDMPGMIEPATAEVISLPDHRAPRVNDVHLSEGRLPDPGHRSEVVVLDAFARAHSLAPGDEISATLRGRRVELEVVGVALSPEHVYAIAPGQLVPDDRLFAVLWMSRDALAHATDQDGAFNEAVIRLMPGASEDAVIDTLDRLLAPYGAPGAYGRDLQFSDVFLSSELNQLVTMSRILPPIFLFVAAFLVNVVISRIIAVEREQIGLLKAFGYSDLDVLTHYLKLVGVIGLVGLLLGSGLGIALGRWMAAQYAQYFHFPFLIFRADPTTFLLGALITLIAVLGGAAMAARSAFRLRPAVAMVPAPPADYSRAIGASISKLRLIDPQSRMVLRQLFRFPWRGGLTLLGVAASIMLLVSTLFFLDSMQVMIDTHFYQANRYDVAVSLVEPRERRAFHELARVPGALTAEPYRHVPVRLRHGPREETIALIGVPRDAMLSRTLNAENEPVEAPPGGLVLSADLAADLDVELGEQVEVETTQGRRMVRQLPVSAIITSYIGSVAQMELRALNRLLEEGAVVSGAYLVVDPAQNLALFEELKAAPGVAGVALHSLAAENFKAILDQSLGWSIFVYVLFSGMIALGVIYNSVRITFAERARELASLRVLGFKRGEVAYVLLGEIALLTLLALPVGCLGGIGLAFYLSEAMASDVYRLPFVIHISTFAAAIGVVVVIAIGSGLIVRRQIDRLNLVEVLKTRE
ncbi:MAG: ABC transporter permease [Alphaproteobacteria bacterium]|nr:ABC transporter permease [Alphaproteobacteria bacterium]